MAEADRIAAALRYQQELDAAQRPATMNPNIAAQGLKSRNRIAAELASQPQSWSGEALPMEGRAAFLPFQDTMPGSVMNTRSLALPGIVAGAVNAITAPGRALDGSDQTFDPQEEAANFAMNMMGGGIGTSRLAPAPAGSLGMNVIKKGSQEITNNEILENFWKALDNAGDGHIGVRSDDAIIKNSFKKSWNRPDGVKTTRLPGTSVVYVGYDNITKDSLMNAIENSRMYGKNIYLVEGKSPNSIQHLANDPGERLMTNNKILSSIINTKPD